MLTAINSASRRRRIGRVLGAVGTTALLAAALPELTAAGQAVVAAASPATVDIDNFSFALATLTVTAGTTVTWKNEDGEPHTVVSTDGLFRSAALDENDTFKFTFSKPGTYKYVCSIHPKMVGKITVK